MGSGLPEPMLSANMLHFLWRWHIKTTAQFRIRCLRVVWKSLPYLLAISGTQQDWHWQQDRMVGKTGCWKWTEKVLRSAGVGSSASVVAGSIFSCGVWASLWHVGSSSLAGDQTRVQSLNHWATRKVPRQTLFDINVFIFTCTEVFIVKKWRPKEGINLEVGSGGWRCFYFNKGW